MQESGAGALEPSAGDVTLRLVARRCLYNVKPVVDTLKDSGRVRIGVLTGGYRFEGFRTTLFCFDAFVCDVPFLPNEVFRLCCRILPDC